MPTSPNGSAAAKPDARRAFRSRQTSMKRSFRRTFDRAASCRRVKLLKFGLKFLVDKQQSFHCADHVAATAGYNLIDNGIRTIEVAVDYGVSQGNILRLKMLHATPSPARMSGCARYSQDGTDKYYLPGL
jgi:hypothetical protein